MERRSRGKGKRKLLGGHQKCWIWGRNAVLETLAAGRWPLLDLYLSRGLEHDALERAHALCRRSGLVPVVDDPDALTRLCHTSEHQGYLARMTEFPYADAESALPSLPETAFCVVLDGIQDAHNFGAIVRSAEIFGAEIVFIGETRQVGVTSMVVRSSAGAVNRIPIARVADLPEWIGRLAGKGIPAVAASEKAGRALMDHDFRGSAAVVIGNEGVGPSQEVLARCETSVRIPQTGRIGSLNAAVAAGIFFYEIRRQRG